jgi:hypothetical protein
MVPRIPTLPTLPVEDGDPEPSALSVCFAVVPRQVVLRRLIAMTPAHPCRRTTIEAGTDAACQIPEPVLKTKGLAVVNGELWIGTDEPRPGMVVRLAEPDVED